MVKKCLDPDDTDILSILLQIVIDNTENNTVCGYDCTSMWMKKKSC